MYTKVWDSKCLQSTCRVLKKGSTKEVHACAKYQYNRWAVGYAVCLPILASDPCKMHIDMPWSQPDKLRKIRP